MNHELDPDGQETTAPEETAEHAGNALALRTAAMRELDAVEAGLADLETKYRNAVFDTATTAGMEEAKAARVAIREPRYKAENVRKDKTKQLAALSREINDRASQIKDRILAVETPIHEQITAEEVKREAAREAKRKAEAERIAAMNANLDRLRNTPLAHVGASAADILVAIEGLEANDLAEFDEVYQPTAEQTHAAALDALRRMLSEREALDAQQAELDRLRAEQAAREAEAAEARRIADAEAQAERDRLAAEAKAKADQEAQERAQAQAAEDAARAERQASEDAQRAAQAAEMAEQRRLLDEQQAEARAAAAKAAQEAQEAAERAAQEQRDREVAEAQARELAQAAADAEAIRVATLYSAAEEALALLDELGQSSHLVARKLTAALSRETQA